MNEQDPELEAWHLSQIKQRRSRLNAKPIGAAVRQVMSRSGYGQNQAVEQLHETWREAVGPVLAGLTQPGKISRGVLLVIAADSSTVQELHFRKKDVLNALQAAIPAARVTDLKFRVGPIG